MMQHLFKDKHVKILFWLIPLLSIALHWRIFTTDLVGVHLWRQSQTQLNIQNFYRHDFNILNPRVNITNLGETTIYRYEFPIMQWCIAAVHKVFGESISITRICLFLLGLCTVYGMFFLGNTLFKDRLIAGMTAWAFNFSPLFYYYTMNPIPDNLALCATVWGLAWFFKYKDTQQNRHAIFSAIFMLLAVWAKLPFILFYATIGLYLFVKLVRKAPRYAGPTIITALLYFVFLLPAVAWYAWVIPGWKGNGVLTGILEHKITWAEAMGILSYHAKVMFPKLILSNASLALLIASVFFLFKNKAYWKGNFWLLAASGMAVLAYWVFEFNMINTIHDYYMMPFLIPLFVLVGYGIKHLLQTGNIGVGVTLVLLLSMPIFAYRNVQHFWSIEKSFVNPALLQYRDELRAAVPKDEICIMQNDISMHIYPYALDKRGPVFSKDELPVEWVDDMIRRQHIRYMYSDARKVDENPAIVPYFDSLLLEKGSMRVYRLKTAEQLAPVK